MEDRFCPLTKMLENGRCGGILIRVEKLKQRHDYRANWINVPFDVHLLRFLHITMAGESILPSQFANNVKVSE